MVNENLKVIVENKKPFETVYEIKNEIPSFEEFMKTYESDGNLNYDDLSRGNVGEVKWYGPCRNTLCGCGCSSDTCVCDGGDASIFRKDNLDPGLKVGNFTATGREVGWRKDLSGDVSASLIRGHEEGVGDIKFVSGSAGITLGRDNTAKVQLGVNLVDYKANGVRTRVGVNVDTGGSVNSDGAEFKFLGFGLSAGKKNEISTPFFSISKDSDDCIIQ